MGRARLHIDKRANVDTTRLSPTVNCYSRVFETRSGSVPSSASIIVDERIEIQVTDRELVCLCEHQKNIAPSFVSSRVR